MAAAAECCYLIVRCSALNAEELRRHGGAGGRLREVRQRPERQQQGGRRGRGGVHPHRALLLRQRPVRGVSGPPDRDAGACEEYLQTDVLQAPPLQRD